MVHIKGHTIHFVRWPRLKSAHEIKWNLPGNCSLLFRTLISRRRYRETLLQRVVREPGKTRGITFFLQASA